MNLQHIKTYRTMELKILFKDGQPCKHQGCLNHQSHSCEGCGRIAGQGSVTENPFDRKFSKH